MVSPTDYLKLIAGAYSLLNLTAVYENGTRATKGDPAQGKNGTGYLTYSASGYVSAILIPSNQTLRPRTPIYDELETGTDADWAIIGKHNLAYAGPVSVEMLGEDEEDEAILTHGPLVFANVPSFENTTLFRNATLVEGGKLLKLRTYSASDQTHGTLFWQRLTNLQDV